MKTLFESLKSEVLELLETQKLNMPYTFQEVCNDLQNNNNWLNLKYSTICYLAFYLELESFSPKSIDKLFNKE